VKHQLSAALLGLTVLLGAAGSTAAIAAATSTPTHTASVTADAPVTLSSATMQGTGAPIAASLVEHGSW
jgi:hypothetical protein